MEYFILVGIAVVCIIALQFTKEKKIMRISWDKVAQFCGFMVLLTILRIASYDFMLQNGIIKELPGMYPEILANRWTLVLVFWEDLFFGVPLYFIHKYFKSPIMRRLKWPLTILISMIFGMGHAYQGIYGMLVTSTFPYFISRKYGERHGFGTMAICHILYDNITVYSMILLPYLLC